MAPTTIARATWTDDDGTGLTGTIINNARLQTDLYDKIDGLFSGSAGIRTAGRFAGEGVQSITLAAGTTNNQAINAGCQILLLTGGGGGSTLTGIVAPAGGDFLFVRHVAGGNLTLSHEGITSAAANRFSHAGGADLVLNTFNGGVLYIYDLTTARWVAVKGS